jgi:hypothetical protein
MDEISQRCLCYKYLCALLLSIIERERWLYLLVIYVCEWNPDRHFSLAMLSIIEQERWLYLLVIHVCEWNPDWNSSLDMWFSIM